MNLDTHDPLGSLPGGRRVPTDAETAERVFRFDVRGNEPGVAAEFSLAEERPAFAIPPQYGEIDYRVNFPAALPTGDSVPKR